MRVWCLFPCELNPSRPSLFPQPLFLLLAGGFYVRNIPVWISWMKYLSFIYWAWNLTLKIEFGGDRAMVPSACGPTATSCTVAEVGVCVCFM
jgi:hypothetical protein